VVKLSRVLDRAPALAPLGLAEIALARIGPSPSIAIKDFAKCVEHFRSHPNTPACKGFTCSSARALLFPSSAHGGNFQRVGAFNFRFRHSLQCYERLLRTPCLDCEGFANSFYPLTGEYFLSNLEGRNGASTRGHFHAPKLSSDLGLGDR
jgi:hypothetical protein